MENEIWKAIKNYEHRYAVSSFGNIRSFVNGNKLLVIKYKPTGYAFVCLSKNNIQKYYHVHRLVAEAFIPNINKKPEVNHLDCNKKNNHVSNLEWCTRSENAIHARKNITFKLNISRGINHSCSCPVIQKSTAGEVLFIWENISIPSVYYGASVGTISVALRRNGSAVGFLWERTTKEYYLENKYKFIIPPQRIINNYRIRDLTKAHEAKRIKNSSITPDFLLKHGIWCLKKYGNIRRDTFEKYARERSVPGYKFVINNFNKWDCFKQKVNSMAY